MNKKLLIIIIILIPITILSFFKKETNFFTKKTNSSSSISVSEKQPKEKQQYVDLNYKNNLISLPLEEYVVGVIAAEMPASFELEALKAQAVASRTYVLKHLENNSSIGSTTSSQVYIDKEAMQEKWQENFDKYYNKILDAVNCTKGLVIKYNGNLIKSYYYSMSNGYTESSINVFNEKNDYLTTVESKWDSNNEKEIAIPKQEFCQTLQIECNEIIISNINRNESNRISSIQINNKEFTGINLRKLLNLRSTDFSINIKDDIVTIKTKGYGHGVGMSQYGANFMAKEGYDYKQILAYYYQNTEITNF